MATNDEIEELDQQIKTLQEKRDQLLSQAGVEAEPEINNEEEPANPALLDLLNFNENLLGLYEFAKLLAGDKLNLLIGFIPMLMELERLQKEAEAEGRELKSSFKKGEKAFSLSSEDIHDITQAAGTIKKWNRIGSQLNNVRTSVLLSAVASVEWLIRSLLTNHWMKDVARHPSAKENTLSFEDLTGFDSIEDAKNHLVSNYVDNLMRGDVASWIRGLKTVSIAKTPSYFPLESIEEVFQRRNLLAHNRGLVNGIYLSKVKIEHQLKIGDRVRIDDGYLEEAIDLLHGSFLLLGFEIWKKTDGLTPLQVDAVNSLCVEALSSERWELAEKLATFGLGANCGNQSVKLFLKFNRWQSFKWRGDFSRIKSEVLEEDLTACGPLYQMARHALLDEFDDCLDLLKNLVASEQLSPNELVSWPLFRGIRADRLYREKFSKVLDLDSE